jgi:hypothetical protein
MCARRRRVRFSFLLSCLPCAALVTLNACESPADNPYGTYTRVPADRDVRYQNENQLEPPTVEYNAPQEQLQEPEQVPADQNEYADTDPSALDDFQQPLQPYGTWTDDPTYGTIWQPYPYVVGIDFMPYVSEGHWAWDYDDWVWVSDYPWGWIPFHYGRWAQVGGRGWCWVPGRQYAGAWVDWRSGNGYVGWSPMAPRFGWRGHQAYQLNHEPPEHWAFRRNGDVFASSQDNVVVGRRADELARTVPHYQSAARTVAGTRPLEQTRVRGPEPQALGVSPQAIVRPQPTDTGVARARELAKPQTAARYGARAPTEHVVRPSTTTTPTPTPAPSPRPGPSPHVHGQTVPQRIPSTQTPERSTTPSRQMPERLPSTEPRVIQPTPAPMPAPAPRPAPAPMPAPAPHIAPAPHFSPPPPTVHMSPPHGSSPSHQHRVDGDDDE